MILVGQIKTFTASLRDTIRPYNLIAARAPICMHDSSELSAKPIVFVHIPKTAGTSFRLAAQNRFGRSRILKDYGPDSSHTSTVVKKTVYGEDTVDELLDAMLARGCQFFTGHFHVSKYRSVFGERVRWCTFIRHPVNRVVSEFLHMSSEGTYSKSLVDFINEPQQCNRQARLISGIELRDFFFVGVTEMYRDSISLFNQLTALDFSVLKRNVGNRKAVDIGLNDELSQQIEANNRRDLALYRAASALLLDRLKQG
jgi:hypothetical protein